MNIEEEIVEKGLTAPRITMADIEAKIADEFYFTAANGVDGTGYPRNVYIDTTPTPLEMLTFCVLVLRNGFTVTGESACVSPQNFDADIGKKIAHQNAVDKIWLLEGYLLKERVHECINIALNKV